MKTLGFAIKLVCNGARNVLECNKGQWTSKVVDIREYLKLFDGLIDTDNIVTFMSFDEGGCYLTLLKALSVRVGDCLSGWIYIPNTIRVTDDEIMNVYTYVHKIILHQSSLDDDDREKIKDFFSKEYPKRAHPFSYIPTCGEKFGYRNIANPLYSMKEIIGVNRYQPYYKRYKAIFLLDMNSKVKIAKRSESLFDDLTKENIDQYCTLLPPSSNDVHRLGKGAKILIRSSKNEKREFDSPILRKKGDVVQLDAFREGFERSELPDIKIEKDEQTCSIPLPSKGVKWNKRIYANMFTIIDEKNNKIDNARITIKGKEIKNSGIPLPEDDCKHVIVKISAPSYEPVEQPYNLLLYQQLKVQLRRKVLYSDPIIIKLANDYTAEMTLKSPYLPSDADELLRGYVFEENVLRMSQWFVWKQRLWGFLAAWALVLLFMAYTAFSAWLDTHRFKYGLPPWEDIPAQQSSSSGASKVVNK